MKKYFRKMKAVLTTFGVTLLSFSSKVMGQLDETIVGWQVQNQSYDQPVQGIYGVPQPESKIDIAIKIFPRLLVAITFIVGIVSFLKIRKIDDKVEKKKMIKKIIIILLTIIIATFLITKLLIWFFTPIPIAYMI